MGLCPFPYFNHVLLTTFMVLLKSSKEHNKKQKRMIEMREIFKKAYIVKVKEKRELKALCSKMFSLEADLVFWNQELENKIMEERFVFQKQIEALDAELAAMREEHQFTLEEKREMKKQLEKGA